MVSRISEILRVLSVIRQLLLIPTDNPALLVVAPMKIANFTSRNCGSKLNMYSTYAFTSGSEEVCYFRWLFPQRLLDFY